MIVIKILYCLFGIALWVGVLKYRKMIYGWTGKFYWAEKYLGSGGTLFIIILTGLWLIGMSVAYPFGAFDETISSSQAPETSIQE